MPRKRWIQKHPDTGRPHHGVEQQLKSLTANPSFAVSHPSEVTAWLRNTLHDPKPDRIRHEGKHDRNRELRTFEGDRRWRSDRNNHVGLLCSNLSDELIEPIGIAFSAQKINL